MSRSSSSQSQASTFTDNRAVLGEGSNYANNGASITNTSYVLDNGAINRSFDFGAAALDLGGQAIGAASSALDSSLTFANNNASRAYDFSTDIAGQAFDANRFTTSAAFDFGTDALQGALSANTASTAQAFNFGNDALSAADTAFAGALSFGRTALDANDNAYSGAMSFARGALNSVLGNVQSTQQLTANAYNDAKGRGALTDKIIIGAIGAMALVALIAVRKG